MINIFLDSGAHSLYTKKVIDKHHKDGYNFYDTKEFWDYVDAYATFIKKYKKFVGIYVNVDVIFNPDLSWKVQKYIEEKHVLNPLPVIHYGTDSNILTKYLKKYKYIGLGGLGQEVTKNSYINWADRMFDIICDNKSRLPIVKVHGFALTSLQLMFRYPWYSVDSTTWLLTGRMGSVLIPKVINGNYDYTIDPHKVVFSSVSPKLKEAGKHFNSYSNAEKELILEYLKERNYIYGVSEFKEVEEGYKLQNNERWAEASHNKSKKLVEVIIEPGVSNNYKFRDELNIFYFLDLEKNFKPWPWPFKLKAGGSFNL